MERSTVRRQDAAVVAVACPACKGRGWAYVSDDWSPPVETTCRRCNGRGLVEPPAGSRAATIVALVPPAPAPVCPACGDTGELAHNDLCFCDSGYALFLAYERDAYGAVA